MQSLLQAHNLHSNYTVILNCTCATQEMSQQAEAKTHGVIHRRQNWGGLGGFSPPSVQGGGGGGGGGAPPPGGKKILKLLNKKQNFL